jgi:hypothetical protein
VPEAAAILARLDAIMRELAELRAEVAASLPAPVVEGNGCEDCRTRTTAQEIGAVTPPPACVPPPHTNNDLPYLPPLPPPPNPLPDNPPRDAALRVLPSLGKRGETICDYCGANDTAEAKRSAIRRLPASFR